MSKVNEAAFFDLDNTVVSGSSLYHFARGLIAEKELTRRQIARFAWHNFRFIHTKTENEKAIHDATRRVLSLIAGKHESRINEISERVVAEFVPRKCLLPVLERVREHQTKGHATWLVTAAPIEIARVIASLLRMTGAVGTESEIVDGQYSGNLVNKPMHGINKALAIQELAKRHGYSLQRCYAYGDSKNDLPMLVSVGNVAIVNPNKPLTSMAHKNSWPILIA